MCQGMSSEIYGYTENLHYWQKMALFMIAEGRHDEGTQRMKSDNETKQDKTVKKTENLLLRRLYIYIERMSDL